MEPLVYILILVVVILTAKVWRMSSRLEKTNHRLKKLSDIREEIQNLKSREKYFQNMQGIELDFAALEQKIEEERDRMQAEVALIIAGLRKDINENTGRIDEIENIIEAEPVSRTELNDLEERMEEAEERIEELEK